MYVKRQEGAEVVKGGNSKKAVVVPVRIVYVDSKIDSVITGAACIDSGPRILYLYELWQDLIKT